MDLVVSANSAWNLINFRVGLIQALVKRGYRVTALAPADPGATALPRLPCHSLPVAIDRSGLNPFRDIGLLWAYYRAFRRIRPAAYLSFTVKPNIYGALAARLAGIPSLPNVSGLGTAFINDGFFARFVSRMYAAAFRKSAVVFFQNPDDRKLFVERGIVKAEQARLLPGSGVNLNHFQPGPERADEPPTFLFIGRLLGDKGVREFAEAARMVKRELPDARFQLLGAIDDGNRSAIGRDELARWVADGAVEYLGSSGDVRPHIERSTAVVLPSYREGLPRTLLEGAATARPLVATDVPGNREIVVDGVTGLLCEARSSAALAAAMRRMAEMTPKQRSIMGKAARAKVEREFSETLVIQIYIDALQQLASPQGA